MSFSFEDDFLDLAETLSQGSDEASLRSAVSRAYYAAFHAARELCKKRGLESGWTAHAGLWQHFKRKPGNRREFYPLYTRAKRLQEARESADYELKPEIPIDWARQSQTSLTECRRFLKAVEELS